MDTLSPLLKISLHESECVHVSETASAIPATKLREKSIITLKVEAKHFLSRQEKGNANFRLENLC